MTNKMSPSEIALSYDQITHLWLRDDFDMQAALPEHKRAIQWYQSAKQEQNENSRAKEYALDVGCGCTGRLTKLFLEHDLHPICLDVSDKMLEVAKERMPEATYLKADICAWQKDEWKPQQLFGVISVWDSFWHIPLEQQLSVLNKLINWLVPGGVLIFSFGGVDKAGEHINTTMGPNMYYASHGTANYLRAVTEANAVCRHLEYKSIDDLHCHMVVQKL